MASTDNQIIVVGRDPLPSVLHIEGGEELRMTIIVPEGVSCEKSMEIHLDGPGASLDIAGAWRCSSSERVHLQVIVRHNAPHCHSEQLFKGVVSGSARAEFDGLVYVAPGAMKTVAHQQAHSLLLSADAFCEARPQLEIYADDVECSHGATTGYLNPEELFYMRSRGIPEEEARAIQVEAFLAPVLNRLP
ncbi:MAG: SufD family Fe-S cluster assembly protein [Bacteroidales bacterium]|nr:SufD family Fe-S cluster assembly protein [Bacteroidales bacterium]